MQSGSKGTVVLALLIPAAEVVHPAEGERKRREVEFVSSQIQNSPRRTPHPSGRTTLY